ncbi:MAG: hypothetical protein AAFQ43_03670 [Bacteroidota bacterium]
MAVAPAGFRLWRQRPHRSPVSSRAEASPEAEVEGSRRGLAAVGQNSHRF